MAARELQACKGTSDSDVAGGFLILPLCIQTVKNFISPLKPCPKEDKMIKSRLTTNLIACDMYRPSSLFNGSDGAFVATNSEAKTLYREITVLRVVPYAIPLGGLDPAPVLLSPLLRREIRVFSKIPAGMSSTPVKRRESPWGLPEGDTRQPQPHRCNDRAEDVIQVLSETPFSREEPTEPYTYLQIDPPKRQETILE
ncbi:hypothetical protein ACLOJK_039531 [Asimina triloba]